MKEALEPDTGDAEVEFDMVLLAVIDVPEAAASLRRKDIWFRATDCLLGNDGKEKTIRCKGNL